MLPRQQLRGICATYQVLLLVAPPAVVEVAVPPAPGLSGADLHDVGHVPLHGNCEFVGQYEVLFPQDPHVLRILGVVTEMRCTAFAQQLHKGNFNQKLLRLSAW